MPHEPASLEPFGFVPGLITTFSCYPPLKSLSKAFVRTTLFVLVSIEQSATSASALQPFAGSKIRCSGIVIVIRVSFVHVCEGVKRIVYLTSETNA